MQLVKSYIRCGPVKINELFQQSFAQNPINQSGNFFGPLLWWLNPVSVDFTCQTQSRKFENFLSNSATCQNQSGLTWEAQFWSDNVWVRFEWAHDRSIWRIWIFYGGAALKPAGPTVTDDKAGNAPTLPAHCQHIVSTLPHCQPIVSTLPAHCQHIASTMSHCQHIVSIASHCTFSCCGVKSIFLLKVRRLVS